MKRVFLLLLAAAFLLSLAPAVFAAGSASLNGPSVVRSGDTITLTFYAGGGIYGGSGTVNYDASQLTLIDYKQTVGGSWAVDFNGNRFVFYDNNLSNPINGSASIFQATFTVAADLATGTTVTVTASGVTLSDGKQDTSVGSCTYSIVIAPPLSANANLESLILSNAELSPAFSPSVTSYSVSVPYSVSSLELTASAADAAAKVNISNPSLTPGGTTGVSVIVTAENGSTKTYTIYATRAQDPNYVKSSNANLKELSAEGFLISPVFSPDITQYYLWLPYETNTISLSAKTDDDKATLKIGETPTFTPGMPVNIPVTVTAENGTELIYTVTVFRAPDHADLEAFFNAITAEPTQPTEPVTEPTTEPTTETTTEPTTEPTTEATTEPTVSPTTDTATQNEPGTPAKLLLLYILGGIICATAGAIIGIFLTKSASKRKGTA